MSTDAHATPTLILVTGEAGSGKTTLAHELARRVGCPALCRDELKEGMVHSHPGFVPATSDPLTRRTYDVFFTTIDLWLAADVTLVAEAAFQHHLWRQGLSRLQAAYDLRIVRCRLDPEVARARQLARMADVPTRKAHADAEHANARSTFVPINLDRPTIDVDTSDSYHPPLEAVTAFLTLDPPLHNQ